MPLDLAVARRVGASLVEAGILDVSALPATVTALGRHLPAVLADAGAPDPPDTALALLAAVVQGYSTRLRDRVLEEQETVRRAEVQARWTTEEALRSSEARFRAVFENAGIGIGIADMQGEIVDANRAFAALLGYSLEEFLTLRVDDFVDPHDAPDMWDMYREIIEGRREIARVEKRYLHRDGHAVWTNLVASLIRGSDGQPLYTVAMVEDVTGRRELQAELRRQAMLDPLTGLPNRALVHDRLADVFARGAGRIGVCYLDLDRFKVVNDRLGHDVGDALLVEVAARFDTVVSARGHLVARMGGDEFVVLVDNPSDGELELLAETLLSVLEAPVQVDDQTLNVSASIGLVEDDVTATSPADVLKAADVTLYWAKADGRNRWAVFDPERNARDMTRYTLAATLKQGLDRGEFEIEYQPIVDLADGRGPRRRGPRAVDAPHPRHAEPRGVHRPRRGDRLDRAARAPRAAEGLRAGRSMATRSSGPGARGQREPRRPPGAGPRPGRGRRAHPGGRRPPAAPAPAGAHGDGAPRPGRPAGRGDHARSPRWAC